MPTLPNLRQALSGGALGAEEGSAGSKKGRKGGAKEPAAYEGMLSGLRLPVLPAPDVFAGMG